MTTRGSETAFVDHLISGFIPSPRRRNAPHESDAELIDILGRNGDRSIPLLAVTTDTICEEIEVGLYRDPYLAGWMVVMANLSDLAAVGAEPLGLLVSETLPEKFSSAPLERLQAGIADACSTAGTHVLGGDTNFGASLSLTGTAIGLVETPRPLCRRGCAPGDLLFVSGPLGRGNGFALSVLENGEPTPFPAGYLPAARIGEGRLLPGVASSCMDTSDGFFSTLDQLGRTNGVGFSIGPHWRDLLDQDSVDRLSPRGLPAWLLLAGCHGEFELVFTVNPSLRDVLMSKASSIGWEPLEIGTVTGTGGVRLPVEEGIRNFDVAAMRNLSFRRRGGVGAYLKDLLTCGSANELKVHGESKKGV